MKLLYYVWRGYAMSKRSMSLLKGIGVGLLLCGLAMECWKIYNVMHDPKCRRRRRRLQQDTGRAMRVVGDVIGDMECLFAK